jgi:hypothetical protein
LVAEKVFRVLGNYATFGAIDELIPRPELREAEGVIRLLYSYNQGEHLKNEVIRGLQMIKQEITELTVAKDKEI